MTIDTRIFETRRVDATFGEFPFLFLPGRDLFALRAARFRHLSEGHPMGEYLAFLAFLAEAQQEAMDRFPPVALPAPEKQARCRAHGMPLLGARSLQRDPAWRTGLAMILRKMEEATLPASAREAIAVLLRADETGLEITADRTLAGDLAAVPPCELPFVAAALQVYWVRMASSCVARAFGRLAEAGVCPVCGSYPTAGIVRSGGAEHGLRYLCCSLCASQWHVVRITCSRCRSTNKIDYHSLAGATGAVKTESCDTCGTYLKLLYMEKDARMEAMADDLATLVLDFLMDAAGKVRGGPNLFFHPGG